MTYRLLYKLLHDDTEITDRVGTRIYAENAPAKTVGPCIVLRMLSTDPSYHLQNETSVAAVTMQVDYYDSSATLAEVGYQLIRNLLSGRTPANVTVLNELGEEETVRVQAVVTRRGGMLIADPRDGSDRWSYRFSADFELFHSQDVPTHA